MTPELWQRVEEVIGEVLELPVSERRQALVDTCGGDRELRSQVESLLASEGSTGDLLETPVFSLHAKGFAEPAEGDRIGPYRVQHLLGDGGMGAVYLAVRVDEFEKQVALKLLKSGIGGEHLVRRFHHERRILARLDHPNIAKLLDGGTTDDGLPYFVMEYVEGEPIDLYCDRRRLPVSERLELFRKVCAAVHLAHQNLVVHRDLKPGNILVGVDGEPKLLDFGIAKPLEAAGSALETTTDGLRPMTLAYASPEQVALQAVTTVSDVYSLGVVLYELLTGRRPYRLSTQQPLLLARAIQEQEPEKPSTTIEPDTGTPTEEVAEERARSEDLAERRASDFRGLKRRLEGDLDSIVLMALRKTPARRYASVEQLSADVRRHLEGLPVIARPPTLVYQMGKFVRRHRIETFLATLVLATIIGFGLTALVLRDRAVLERERAEDVTQFLVRLFEASDPNTAMGEEVTAREILDRGGERIRDYRDREPTLYAMLAATMGHTYYNLGLYSKAQPLLEEALSGLRDFVGEGDDPQLAIVLNDLAAVLLAQGERERAEPLLREGVEMKIRLFGEDDPEVVPLLNNLGTLAAAQGDYPRAEALYRRGLAQRERFEPPVPEDVATSLSLLGLVLLEQQELAEAESVLRRGLAVRREIHGDRHPSVAKVLNNLAIVLQMGGDNEESEKLYRQALAIRQDLLTADHPDIASTATNLASLLVTLSRYDEAEPLARGALAALSGQRPDHWRTAYAQSVLGGCLSGLRRFEEAETLLGDGYATLREKKSTCHRVTLEALRRWIDFLTASGRAAEVLTPREELRQCER